MGNSKVKASTRLRKAEELHDKMNALLDSVSDELNSVIGEQGELRVFFQTDGLVVNNNYGDNFSIRSEDIDGLLKLGKVELLNALEARSI